MSDLELYDKQESVIGLFHQGLNATEISREIGLARKDVNAVIAAWREAAREDTHMRDIARDALNKMVDHYDKLIKKYYELLSDLDEQIKENGILSHQFAAQKNSALKAIAELEAKRVDSLQKAGMLDAHELGDELAKMEEDKQMVFDILRHDLCDVCRPKVMRKIGEASGRVEVVVVHE